MPLRSCAWRITKTWWNSLSALILVLSTAPHQSFLELVFSRMRFKIVTAHVGVLGRHVCSELPRTFWDRLRYHLGRPHNSGYRAAKGQREPQVLTAPAHRTDPDAIVWRGDVFPASGGRGCDDIRHATGACGVCQHEAGLRSLRKLAAQIVGIFDLQCLDPVALLCRGPAKIHVASGASNTHFHLCSSS